MTAMVDITDLLRFALPYVPNAPEPLLVQCFRDAARTFCERTKLWREADSFEVSSPEFEGLTTIGDAEIIMFEDVELDGEPLEPITVLELDRDHSGWRTDTEESSARYVTQFTPNALTIYPRATGTLTMGLVLKPSVDAQTFPEFLYRQYGPDLGRAAAGLVAEVPNAEFSNPELAVRQGSRFTGFVDASASRARRGQQGAPVRTRARFL